MSSPLRSRSTKKLSQNIVENLIEKIQSNEYQVGDKIPTELELIDLFDVSRSVIREAITELRSLGYVETRHGIGTFVKEHQEEQSFLLSNASLETINDIVSLLELRISLESEAVFLASERRKDAHIKKMKAALDDFESHISASANDGTVKADYDFHIAIAEASENQYFVDFLKYLGEKIIPRARVNSVQKSTVNLEEYLRAVHHDHMNIYSAIVDQDGLLARQMMRAHLSKSIKKFRQ
ncbi:FadR/GntR family transcriptional regulator [Acinetobacter pragensis]|uniref:GntR family transcriptional regulator n=1 Tax=Acinetobacter pragensis TaxID=1806892 RepID=A0A151Y2W4_9GAMM|nr:FadR/GntR family transcriptional regulator [Acinetobacter pragensis]KYQ72356.1 GntR family transcriptional regulator [Acinetobacter pragensis]